MHHGTGTFEIDALTAEDMAGRRAEMLARGLPWLVATTANEGESGSSEVIGFAYANWFKLRPACRFSVEDSVYVAANACGQGAGRALLSALLREAKAAGVRKLLAVIGDSVNRASIQLHASAGFGHAGVLRLVGWKHGAWRDVVLMEKPLGAGDCTSPE